MQLPEYRNNIGTPTKDSGAVKKNQTNIPLLQTSINETKNELASYKNIPLSRSQCKYVDTHVDKIATRYGRVIVTKVALSIWGHVIYILNHLYVSGPRVEPGT